MQHVQVLSLNAWRLSKNVKWRFKNVKKQEMNWNIGSMEPGMSQLKNYLKMVEGSKI
jgi:hypothetical protein